VSSVIAEVSRKVFIALIPVIGIVCLQIQLRHQFCPNSVSVTCVCGVAIREYDWASILNYCKDRTNIQNIIGCKQENECIKSDGGQKFTVTQFTLCMHAQDCTLHDSDSKRRT
jgi:hypothetical protein